MFAMGLMHLFTADGLDAAADEDSGEDLEEIRDQGLVEVLASEQTSTIILVKQILKKPCRRKGKI